MTLNIEIKFGRGICISPKSLHDPSYKAEGVVAR